jgi:hypothetical protein
VGTREELQGALVAALSSDRPSLIGAHVDQSQRDEWFDRLRG